MNDDNVPHYLLPYAPSFVVPRKIYEEAMCTLSGENCSWSGDAAHYNVTLREQDQNQYKVDGIKAHLKSLHKSLRDLADSVNEL